MPLAPDLREDRRNRVLRRGDWRFLLPDPRPERSVCFTDGLLREAVEAVSGCVVDPREALAAGCDLAVAADPDDAMLRAAWSALRSGGTCYIEWHSRRVGARAVRRRLERAGFADVRCHWPWPSLRRCHAWVPLEAPGAQRYYFRDNPRPFRAWPRKLLGAAQRAAVRLALRFGMPRPLCVIARRPCTQTGSRPAGAGTAARPLPDSRWSADHDGPGGSALLGRVSAEWPRWGLGPVPAELSCILITGGPRSISKVVGLVFGEPDPAPRVAIKMARVPESVEGLAREARVLRVVHALRPGGVPGVPRALLCERTADSLAVWETPVVGTPIWALLRRHSYRRLALEATDWLAELATCAEPAPARAPASRLMEPALDRFEESFGSIADPVMVRETRAILAGVGDLPVVCEQRDFSPWNVLRTPAGELGVLDWESAEPEGLPSTDLIYFLTYLAFFVDRAMRSRRFRRSYRAGLSPGTLTGAAHHECLARYADRVGLSPDALHPLRLFTWVLHSRSEYRHFLADAARTPTREALRRSVSVGLWEEELRCGGAS